MKFIVHELSQLLVLSSMLLLLVVSTTFAQTQTTTTVKPGNGATVGASMGTIVPITEDITTGSNGTTKVPATQGPTTKGPTTKGPRPPTTTPKAAVTTKKPMTPAGQTTPEGSSTKSPSKGGVGVAGVFCIIVLIICLIGIGFCGYQFYRKRQTDDYHTL